MGYMKLADNTCKWNVYISELSLLNLLYVYRQFPRFCIIGVEWYNFGPSVDLVCRKLPRFNCK